MYFKLMTMLFYLYENVAHLVALRPAYLIAEFRHNTTSFAPTWSPELSKAHKPEWDGFQVSHD